MFRCYISHPTLVDDWSHKQPLRKTTHLSLCRGWWVKTSSQLDAHYSRRIISPSIYFAETLSGAHESQLSWEMTNQSITSPPKNKQMMKHDEGYSSGTGGIWRGPAGNYNVQAAPRAAPSSASLTSFEELNCVWRRSDVGRREVHCWHRRPHDQMDERIIIAPPRRDRGPLRVSLGPAAIF